MQSEIGLLIAGLMLGLSAGLSPGPLFTLVISETLRKGLKEGLKLATVPIFTDVPILLAGIFLVSSFSKTDLLLGFISIIGSLVLAYFAWENISIKNTKFTEKYKGSFKKGILANFLNPHLYVTVFTVHVPLILSSSKSSSIAPYFYFAGFMATLVGSKIALAIIAHKSRNFMKSKYYIYTIRLLGIMLLVFAIMFFRNGLRYLNLV